MGVDRKLVCGWFSERGAPNWPCMTCGGGHLRIAPNTIQHGPTAHTRAGRDHPGHEPDWDELRAVALATCDNPLCGEVATIVGKGEWAEDYDSYAHELNYYSRFQVTHFDPSPPLIVIPLACPDAAKKEIRKAFVLAWGDPPSAANHLRTAVERVLDGLKVLKTQKASNGSRHRLQLHYRIERIKTRHPEAHAALMAIKWLGNAGSHASDLTQEQLLVAFDIFERALRHLFAAEDKEIRKAISKINANKGPTRTPRRLSGKP